MKKFQPIGGSLASVLLLLTLSAMPTLATTWNESIFAQSAPANPNAPTDTPIPVRVDDRQNNLWWLLILIPVGGLVWAVSRSRRQERQIDDTVAPQIVPSLPVTTVDPVLLNGRAPQPEANSIVERDRELPNRLADPAPVVLPPTNELAHPIDGNGHAKDPVVTTASPGVAVDARSTPAELIVTETSKMPLSHAPEPDRQLTEEIRLLEERLVVDRHKRKVGEVIVRKEIETRYIQVPIQREVLIVEQVDPEFKQLAVVDLGQIDDERTESSPTIAANFTSPTTAIEFLKSLGDRSHTAASDVRLNIVLEDADDRAFYRQWLAQRTADSEQ
jgi:hypothetical protein